MESEIMSTCMLVDIGLSRSECASWVQAWGSILALLIAVAVPLAIRRADLKKDNERVESIAITAAVEVQILVERTVFALDLAYFDIANAAKNDPSAARLAVAMSEINKLQRTPRQSIDSIRDFNPKLGTLITVANHEIDNLLSIAAVIGQANYDSLQIRNQLYGFLEAFKLAIYYFHEVEKKINELLRKVDF